MAIKEKIRTIFSYFELDDQDQIEDQEEVLPVKETPIMRVAPQSVRETQETVDMKKTPSRTQNYKTPEKTSLEKLNARQQELSSTTLVADRTTIDIKYPKRYEDAPEIVNLLIENASVLIDFQFMSETQARRCLDYLDGARSVLAGNLKKVSNTMWLLTPVNVTVNIEELRSSRSGSDSDTSFDFDIRR